jgi:hypothetical protein
MCSKSVGLLLLLSVLPACGSDVSYTVKTVAQNKPNTVEQELERRLKTITDRNYRMQRRKS